VKYLLDELHFDAAIDYKTENVRQRIGELAPKGVNLYFDNVGGEILEAAIDNLAQNARIVACGSISTYNAPFKDQKGIRNLSVLTVRSAKMVGFIVTNFEKEYPLASKDLLKWWQDGKLRSAEDIQEGWEIIPKTFMRIFNGDNLGKQLSKL